MEFWLHPPPKYGMIRDGVTSRITSLNDVTGGLGIQNEVYLAGSVQVIAGFSKIFPVPRGTRSVQISADFLVSGEIGAVGMSLSYARASSCVNIKVIGLDSLGKLNGDNHALRNIIWEQVSAVYYQTPAIGFFNRYLRNDMDPFPPEPKTRQYMLSATIESWASCGGLASWARTNISDQTTFQGFFITTNP